MLFSQSREECLVFICEHMKLIAYNVRAVPKISKTLVGIIIWNKKDLNVKDPWDPWNHGLY